MSIANSNKSFKILKNDTLGRYMVAKKKIKQGELILRDAPALIGPHLNGPAKCFKCLKTINLLRCVFCYGCNVALMCSNTCKGKFHGDQECLALKKVNEKVKGEIIAENPSIIYPLKCLMLNSYKPDLFEEILALETHLEKRRDTVIWRRHRISVEDVLKKYNLLTEQQIQEEIVQKICGILDINSFEVRPPGDVVSSITHPENQCLRALYTKGAMMAHNCLANTHISVDDNFIMSVYARVDINDQDLITINYTNVLEGTQERHEHLMEGKYFSCKCSRCKDPSELGTEISSLLCHKCRRGFLRHTELEVDFKIWQCSECKVCFKNFLIDLAIEEARRRIHDLDPTMGVQALEALYKTLLLTFHPNHYLMLELKQIMINFYSKSPPTKQNLNRKIDLCGSLMSVFSKIEPGISRIRALTMYELQSAIVDISNKQFKDKDINEEELIKELQTAEKILKDSVKFLLYEPKNSPEGRMAQMALNELKLLRHSIDNIKKEFLVPVTEDNNSKKIKEKLNKKKKNNKK